MKKIFSILAFTVLPTAAYSQLPLVEYKPVIIGNSNNTSKEYIHRNTNGYFPNVPSYSTPNRSTAEQNNKTIGAYIFDKESQRFKRIKIKIYLTETQIGETEIYIKAVLDRSSYRESWKSCNNRAIKVSALFDNEIIADNFEWKAENITIGSIIGTIYFNY